MRTPPPPVGTPLSPAAWQQLTNAVYYLWDRLNRDTFTVGDVTIYTGTGTPESNQVGSVGDIFIRTDGGSGTTLYVKESGTGNTGWSSVS